MGTQTTRGRRYKRPVLARVAESGMGRGIAGVISYMLVASIVAAGYVAAPQQLQQAQAATSTTTDQYGDLTVKETTNPTNITGSQSVTYTLSFSTSNTKSFSYYWSNSTAGSQASITSDVCTSWSSPSSATGWFQDAKGWYVKTGTTATLTCTTTLSAATTDTTVIKGMFGSTTNTTYASYGVVNMTVSNTVTLNGAAPTPTSTTTAPSSSTSPVANVTPGSSGGTKTSSDGRISLTKTANTYALAAGGGEVTYTYTVKNLNTAGYMYYSSLTDDKCGSISSSGGDLYYMGNGEYAIPAGGTATWSCKTEVTQNTTNTAVAKFTNYNNVVSTVSATATVNVASLSGIASCDTLWYVTNATVSGNGSLGTTDSKANWSLAKTMPNFTDGYYSYQSGSAAVAVDPSNPNLIYYLPRMLSDRTYYYGGLTVYDTTTGNFKVLLPYSQGIDSVRLGFDTSGTLWTIDAGGYLRSWTSGASSWTNRGYVTLSDGRSMANLRSGDLTFDGLGNLWVIGSDNATQVAYLYTIPSDQLSGNDGATGQLVGSMGAGAFNGIAFDSHGDLYATSLNSSGMSYLHEVNKSSGSTSLIGSVGFDVADLSSCALPKPELRVTKANSPTSGVVAGDVITYTITTENIGNLEAAGVKFEDIIPANTTYVAGSAKLNGTAINTSSTFPYSPAREIHSGNTSQAGVISAGQSATVTFQVKVNDPVPAGVTKIANQGTVTWVGPPIKTDDPKIPGGEDPTENPIMRPAIFVAKTANKTVVDAANGAVTYSYAVSPTNLEKETDATGAVKPDGTEPLKNVTLTDDKCSPVNPVNGAGGTNTGDRNSDGILDPGETWNYTCSTILTSTTTNTAVATGVGIKDAKTVTDNDTWTVTVQQPSINVTKTAGATSTTPDANGNYTVSYTVTAKNNGQGTGTTSAITDTLGFDPNLVPTAASVNGAPVTLSGSTFPVSAGGDQLAPGASKTWSIQVTYHFANATAVTSTCSATPAAGKGLFNSVSMTGDTIPTDNTACVTPPTPAKPAMTFAKSNGGIVDANRDGKNSAGDTVAYTFTMKNTGPLTLKNVTITDDKLGYTTAAPMTVTATTCSALTYTLASGATASYAPATGMAPGSTLVCTAAKVYTLSQTDIDNGKVVNTATATGTTPDGQTPTPPPGTSTVTIEPKPAFTVAKVANTSTFVKGDTITYTFTVKNTGNTTLNDVKVTDKFTTGGSGTASPITCAPTTLKPGESSTCSMTYVANQTDVDAGKLVNVATGTATPPPGVTPPPSVDTPPVIVTTNQTPKIDLVKSVKSVTDVNKNGLNDQGDTIVWQFQVTNSGNVTLTKPAAGWITDSKLAGTAITCNDGSGAAITSLAPNATMTCTAAPYTISATDQAAGAVTNTATAHGVPPTGGDVPSTPSSTTTPLVTPAVKLTLAKTVSDIAPGGNGNGTAEAGETITYTFVVTNNSNVPLSNVSVVEDSFSALGAKPTVSCLKTDLAVGEATTCTATYPASQADVDNAAKNNNGQIVNTAHAVGTPAGTTTPASSNTSSAQIPTPTTSELVLTKSVKDANHDGLAQVGEQLTYSFLVENKGTVTVNNITVNETSFNGKGGAISAVSCTKNTLAPGESVTCTATYTVVAADMDLAKLGNTATASGTTPPGTTVTTPPSSTDIPPAAEPKLENKKTVAAIQDTNANGITDAGDVITWNVKVSNTGNTTINDITITDSIAGVVITCSKSTLLAGETMTCSTNGYIVTPADVIAGKVHNVATTTGTNPNNPGTPVTPPPAEVDTPTTPANPGIAIDKKVDSSTFVKGQTLRYTFTVSNTGNVPLNTVSVKDTFTSGGNLATLAVSCPSTPLAVGTSMDCTATYVATQADVDNGKIDNSATATGIPNGGTPITSTPDTEHVTTTQTASLSLKKLAGALTDANHNDKQDAGDTIAYTFVVTNTGNTTMSTITVSDPMLAAAGITISCPATPLAPNASMTCTASAPYMLKQPDVDAGAVNNTATANGTPPPGVPNIVPPTDTTTTPIVPSNGLELVKKADKTTFVKGDTITYSFTVTNTGTQTVKNLTITDTFNNGGTGTMSTITCPQTELAPGASTICKATYVANQADVDGGLLKNTAVAHGEVPGGKVDTPPSTANVTPSINPGLKVTKTASQKTFVLGDTVTYTFHVENTGNVTMKDITIADTFTAGGTGTMSAITCPAPATLAPGAAFDCTASYTVNQADVDLGKITNAATATGTPPSTPDNPTPPSITTPPSDVTITDEAKPAMTVVKKASQDTYHLGDVITYTFEVKNTGNVTLKNIKVTDAFTTGYGDDSRLSAITCPAGELAVGATATCTATYTIEQADVNSGKLVNTATATGTPPNTDTPIPPTPSNEIIITTEQTKSLSLVKKAGAIVDVNRNGQQDVGDTITYTFEVKNTGNVTMNTITVTDEMLAKAGVPVSCASTPLAPGATMICESAAYPLTLADVNAGKVINTAIAHGTPPSTPDNPTPPATDTPPSTIEVPVTPSPSISVLKSASTSTYTKAGEKITYSFLVTNTGNVTLHNINVTDEFTTGGAGAKSAITCVATELVPGGSTTCSMEYTTTQDDVDTAKIVNAATAHGTPPTGPEVPSKPSEITVTSNPNPALSLKKTAGEIVDANHNGMTDKGDTIVFSFLVKNEGNVTLNAITVNDEMLKAAGVAITCAVTPLAPGESMLCKSAAYALTLTDVNAGHVANSATAIGTPPGSDKPTDPTPPSTTDTPITPAPAMTVKKTANTDTFKAGQTITYSFLVTNTGNVTMSNVHVTDTFTTGGSGVASAITCPKNTLAPGEATTCTMTYVATQADADLGSITNAAAAHGVPPTTPTNPNPPVVDTPPDTVTITDKPEPSLTLVKSANTKNFVVGDTITYSFLVTNTGNVTLKNIRVVDTLAAPADATKASVLTCPDTELAPNETVTCTMTYVAQQADVNNGKIDNSATAFGTPPTGPEVPTDPSTVTVTSPANPKLAIVKSASQSTYKLGDIVTYTFHITNTGNVTMSNITVKDTFVTGGTGTMSAISCLATTLDPGKSTDCSARYTVNQADVDLGKIVNAATTQGTPPGSTTPTDPTPPSTVEITDNPAPGLSLKKSASAIADTNGSHADDAGDTITYSFEVTNTGNVTLTNVVVTDAKLGLTDAACAATLAPGETATCTTTKSYVLNQDDVNAGNVHNSATASGTPPTGPNVPTTPSTTDTPIQKNSKLTITKTASQDTFKAGDTITYTFHVTNEGNTTISDIKVSDTFTTGGTGTVGAMTCPAVMTLEPGKSLDCTMTYVANQADVDLGRIVNAAAVTGTTPDGPTPEVPATPVEITDKPEPALTIEKKASTATFNVNDTITYTFTVKNTGNVTMSNIVVADTFTTGGTGVAGPILCPDTTLAPGESMECTMRYVSSQADVDRGKIVNAASVQGTPPGTTTPIPPVPSNEVPVTHTSAPKLEIVKSSNAVDGHYVVDQTITYSFLVKNTGDVTLHGLAVKDTFTTGGTGVTSAITCPDSTLAPGTSMTCTMTYVTTQADVDAGKIVNEATASGVPPVTPENPTPPTIETPPSTVTITDSPKPAMTVVKTASQDTYKLGDKVVYTFHVTNTGNVTMHDISVTDTFTAPAGTGEMTPITCVATTLVPGASTDCSATYTVVQADVDAGKITNAAIAHGIPPVTPENPTPPTTDTPPSVITITDEPTPSLSIVKAADKQSVQVGEKIVYSFTVTNTGNVTLTNVHVNDPMLAAAGVAISCSSAPLAPGAVMVCLSDPYTTTQADVNNGHVYNTATAAGTPPTGPEVPSTPSETTVPSPKNPKLDLVKTAELKDLDGDNLADVNEKIVFHFTVTNSGNVTMGNVRIDDPMLVAAGVAVTCDPTTLNPGDVAHCASAEYTVTQTDVDRGYVYNVASAHGTTPPTPPTPTTPGTPGTDVPSNPGDSTTPADKTSQLKLTKKVADASGDGIAQLGETLNFTFLVENTGNVTLTNIHVDDQMLNDARVAITCSTEPLAPGASMTCTASPYTVTQVDVNKGHVLNLATAHGTTPPSPTTPPTPENPTPPTTPGTDVPSNPSTTDTPTDSKSGIALVKSAQLNDEVKADGLAQVGETITYSFLVKNTGAVTLTAITVNDPMLAALNLAITCPATPLNSGESMTCVAAKYTVTQTDVNNGFIHNAATAAGTTPGGETPKTPPSETTTPADRQPSDSLVKSAKLNDANGNGKADINETIVYSFLVKNTGTVTLNDIKIADTMANGAVLAITCPATTLAPGEETTCVAAPYTVTQTDVDRGTIDNAAVAHGTTPDVPGVPTTDNPNPPTTPGTDVPSNPSTTETPTQRTPGISVTKKASADFIAAVGDPITFTFVVVNTGNVTLTNVSVSDPMLAAAGIAITCPITTLAPGETVTCTATGYKATLTDLNSGAVTNTATAIGTPPPGLTPPTDDDSVVVPVTPKSDMKIVKSAQLHDLNANGLGDLNETITFSFVVTNNGNQTVKNIVVSDPMLTAAGATITCVATTLDPGTSTTCVATPDYVITQADVDAGHVHNVASVKGETPGGETPNVPSNPTDTPTNQKNSVALVKDAAIVSGKAKAEVGDQVVYTFAVTNTGTTSLIHLTIDDAMLAAASVAITCPAVSSDAPLAPGASLTCTSAPYTVTQADVDRGYIHNVATVTGTTPGGEKPKSPESPKDVPTNNAPQLALLKQSSLVDANGNGKGDLGEVIHYSFVVTNAGTTTMTGFTVDDPMLNGAHVAITCPAVTLAPGQNVTCTAADYVITQDDVDHGTIDNVATASGHQPPTPENPTPPSVTTPPSETHTPADQTKALVLDKMAHLVDANNNGLADRGETIEYSFKVTNSGVVTLTTITIDDRMANGAVLDITCPSTPLAPGASTLCVAKPYTVTQADVDRGSIDNEATASGHAPDGTPVTSNPDKEKVPANPKGALQLVKKATLNDTNGNGVGDLGETIQYSFTVTNTGAVTMSNIVVKDAMMVANGIDIVCSVTSLASGDSVVCEANKPYTLTQADINAGQVVNVATAEGTPPSNPGTPIPSDPSTTTTVTNKDPKLALLKTSKLIDANGNGGADKGEKIIYTFHVSNVGTTQMSKIVVNDPKLKAAGVIVTCPKSDLEVGESMDCVSGEYTVTWADIDAGKVINVAIAEGVVPPPPPNSPSENTPGTPVPSNPSDSTTPVVPPTPANPSWNLVKSAKLADANGNGLADAGETITFSFTIVNTGNVDIQNVSVNDPMLKAAGIFISCPGTTVQTGSQMVCTSAPYTVTAADVAKGSVDNVATAHGEYIPPTDSREQGKKLVTNESSTHTPTPKSARPVLANTGSTVPAIALLAVVALLAGGVGLLRRKAN